MNDTATPVIRHEPEARRFRTDLEGHEAELTYRLDGPLMVIEHTWVPQAIGGRGIAAQLVRSAFEHARDQGLRVVPACSYAAVWVNRHPEFAATLAG